jgi:hypothetical protein
MKSSAISVFLSLLSLVTTAAAMPTLNTELVAVPVPQTGKVTIDGSVDDWDLSGTIYSCPDTQTYAELGAVRSAAMYDADGLYLAFRWVDPTPMANQVDPDEPGKHDRGWASDCLQLRLFNETEVHVTAWYYRGGDKPAMYVHFGRGAEPNQKPELAAGLAQGAKMAFRQHEDGKGYTQEIFLPWKLVSKSGKAYKAGEEFSLGLHFNWGGRDNRSWRALEWQDVVAKPEKVNRIFFWMDRSAWGKITFSPAGNLKLEPKPWELPATGPTGPDLSTVGTIPLEYELATDARVTLVIEDESGKRVRNLIGAYPRSKGANVDFWDGLDDRGKPVTPGAYRWRGLIHSGIDVRYKAHMMPHTNPPWRNAEGTGGWGADHTAPTDVAAFGDRVFLLYEGAESGSALIGCDLEGNKLWGHGGSFQGGGFVMTVAGDDLYYAAKDHVLRINSKTGRAQPFAAGAKQLDFPPDLPPTGIACRGNLLYVACTSADRAKSVLRIFDLTTDQQVRELTTIPSLTGLAVDGKNRLLAVSGNSVVIVDPDTGETTPLVAEGLDNPRGLAVAGDVALYVINGGTHQVFAFNAKGKLKRKIGTAGGRSAVGPWDRNGMRNPSGVAVDGKGNLWVAEHDVIAKRLSKWSPAGKNLGEWFGPTPYGGDGIVDHRDPTRVLCGGLEFVVDYKNGGAHPVYSHLLGVEAGQPAAADTIVNGTFWHRQGFTTTYRGHDYLAYDRGLLCIRRGNAWVPCAAIGNVRSSSQHGDQALWSDRNDNGKVDDAEVVALTDVKFGAEGGGGWGIPWSRHDLSTLRPVSNTRSVRFTPAEFTTSGVPVFDARSVSFVDYAYGTAPVDVDADTMVAFYENSQVPGFVDEMRNRPEGDLSGIKAFDRAGKLVWTYPEPFSGVHGCFKAPLPALPGDVIGTVYMMGTADMGKEIGTILCFNGYYGPRYLFTTDGLFVQTLFKDGRQMPRTAEKAVPEMLVNDMSPGSEAYAGTFSRAQDGRVFMTSTLGGPICIVLGVEGLENLQRLPPQRVTVTAEQIAQGQAMQLARENARIAAGAAAKRLKLARQTRVVDGVLDEPGFADLAVTIEADAQRNGQAALSFDDQNLYVAFRVKDRTPWKNAATDAKTIFLYGDSVDIQLGLDPVAGPNRKKPWAGDIRIAIAPQADSTGSPQADGAIVMLYQPIVPGHKGPREAFVSPVGREEMDRVERIAEAKVAVTRTADGYDVEAAIPLEKLGAKLPISRTIRGDVGVLFSDDTGTECVLRRYWSNRNTNMAADLPSETKLQPDEWGTVVVGE